MTLKSFSPKILVLGFDVVVAVVVGCGSVVGDGSDGGDRICDPILKKEWNLFLGILESLVSVLSPTKKSSTTLIICWAKLVWKSPGSKDFLLFPLTGDTVLQEGSVDLPQFQS